MRRNKTDKRLKVDFILDGEVVSMIVRAANDEKAIKKVTIICKNEINVVNVSAYNIAELSTSTYTTYREANKNENKMVGDCGRLSRYS